MPRKGRFPYEASNTTDDGHYIVGKGRPPESGQFKKDDGRQRGRRPKGTNNLATDLREELGSRVTVTVGGVPKKVSRQRAIVMRLADNATKGQNRAIALALNYQLTLVEPMLKPEGQGILAAIDRADERLTAAEVRTMSYISCKFGDREYEGDLIGVIPVYKEGTYLSLDDFKEIESGLKAYGIELIDNRGCFPPKCKVSE